MMTTDRSASDKIIQETIVGPAGGIERFRLVNCPGFKLIQYADTSGEFFDLIIEDDELAQATISFLERAGVSEITRNAE